MLNTRLLSLEDYLSRSSLIKTGKTYYVDGTSGKDANSGKRPDFAFKTMAKAFSVISDSDTIIVSGLIQEQILSPLGVFDVTIIGAGNRPKHDGGSARWAPAASPAAATANLTLREQGWKVKNILFVCPTDAAGILIRRAEDATYPDGSHAVIEDNIFVRNGVSLGQSGIEDIGGMHNCVIRGNRFEDLTNGIKTVSTGIAVPLQNIIENNDFVGVENECIISGSYCRINGNRFWGLNAAGSANTMMLNTKAVSGQGGKNMVFDNYFHAADTVFADGVRIVGATGDYWNNNRNNNTAAVEVGIPAP